MLFTSFNKITEQFWNEITGKLLYKDYVHICTLSDSRINLLSATTLHPFKFYSYILNLHQEKSVLTHLGIHYTLFMQTFDIYMSTRYSKITLLRKSNFGKSKELNHNLVPVLTTVFRNMSTVIATSANAIGNELYFPHTRFSKKMSYLQEHLNLSKLKQ